MFDVEKHEAISSLDVKDKNKKGKIVEVIESGYKLGEKIIDLQTKTAEYRYDQLLAIHPNIFQRAKLGHIAGYLGIKQQSLSRIRALKNSRKA